MLINAQVQPTPTPFVRDGRGVIPRHEVLSPEEIDAEIERLSRRIIELRRVGMRLVRRRAMLGRIRLQLPTPTPTPAATATPGGP